MPLFILLLLISAVGVFNSLMLNLEGRRIFSEAIENSIDRFTTLESAAGKALVQRGVTERMARVQELESALIREINNPLNCGQGPEARRIIQELKKELPGFMPLSSTGVDCSKNAEVIKDYQTRIGELLNGASWNNPDLNAVRESTAAAKARLQKLSTSAGTMMAPGLLSQISPDLQNINVAYRGDRERLSRQAIDVSALPEQLHLREVNSLGEWSQLLNLIVDRLDTITTYLYIALAFLFDWMMVYLFGLVRTSRPGRSYAVPATGTLRKAW